MSFRTARAQSAYNTRDTELSRAAHQSTELAELAAGKSDFLHGIPPSNSFAVDPLSAGICGSVAACVLEGSILHVDSRIGFVVWIVGFLATTAVLFVASWIDARLRHDFREFERSRERWEVANFPEGEVQEMIQIYSNYGISDEDAESVARTLSKYPDFWVDHMLLHEIGIIPSSMQRESGGPNVLAIGSFLGSFVIPSSIFLGGMSCASALSFTTIQMLVLMYVKLDRCQWFARVTMLSIVLAIFLTVLSTIFVARFLLSFHST